MTDVSALLPWQQPVFDRLIQLDQEAKLPHALLLISTNQDVQQYFIPKLSQRFLCAESANEVTACGSCQSCLLFTASSHPDFLPVTLEEKAKQLKIEQIRKVIDFVATTSQISQRKVITLAPADALNINAANALLKCLEEPQGDTLFILHTVQTAQMLPTILSRCQHYTLPLPSQAEADSWLATKVSEPMHRRRLLFFADNDPAQGLLLYENDDLLLFDEYAEQLKQLMQGGLSVVDTANKIVKQGPLRWFNFLQKLLLALLKSKQGAEQTDPVQAKFQPLIAKANFGEATFYLLDKISEAKQALLSTSNPNPHLLVETLLFTWQQVSQKLLRTP